MAHVTVGLRRLGEAQLCVQEGHFQRGLTCEMVTGMGSGTHPQYRPHLPLGWKQGVKEVKGRQLMCMYNFLS